MTYEKFEPHQSLTDYVECYFNWHSENLLEKEFVVESPPSSFCSLTVNYGDPYFLQNKKYECLEVPMQFVCGLSTYSYKLFLKGRIGITGIVFKPAALATLFGLNGYELTEERVDLYSIFSRDYINPFIAKINAATSAVQRANLLEELLVHHIRRFNPQPDYIDEAANIVVQKNGMLQVNDLLTNSCMSRRTFERRFFQKVGLSPKYYARVRRIGYIFNLVAGKKKVNWPDIFYEGEFYDQAHFIKDFEAFTGRTPQQYLKENQELANYVEKPVTQKLS